MIDPDGFRPNVGIVLMRTDGQLFWARRVNRDGWQFPQGAEHRWTRGKRGTGSCAGKPDERSTSKARGTPVDAHRLPALLLRRGSRPPESPEEGLYLLMLHGKESDLRLD